MLKLTDKTSRIGFWHTHIDYLFGGNKENIKLFTDFMSALLQKRRRRIDYALVIYSTREGVGKTSPLNMLLSGFFGASNVKTVSNKIVKSDYNEMMAESQVVIYEDANAENRYEAIENIKPWITNRVVPRTGKYDKDRQINNFTTFIILTNNLDALALPGENISRRYLVLESKAKPQDAKYFSELMRLLATNLGSVANYYANKAIDFNAIAKRPPFTEAAQKMHQEALLI